MNPWRALTAFLLPVAMACAAGLGADEDKPLRWDGSRIGPVHRIPLKDGLDQPIIPAESYPLPFSARYTCAPCHAYETIGGGLHFVAGAADGPAGRAGEPWFWADERTGTVLPLSFRKWKGTWAPGDVGLTPWEFTRLFGPHLAGGGVSEPGEGDWTHDSRWEVSGPLEINCLGCHNASPRQDPSEWAKQVLRENFRWAATAAAGLGEVGGMASRLPATWDLFDGPNPDDKEWAVVPTVRYDPGLFDSKNNAYLDIRHKPDDGRCLACHSSAPVSARKHDFDADVHTASGLSCVDCHRNGIDHRMGRGYEGEAGEVRGAGDESLTCAGCHLGRDPEKGGRGFAGRLGAPFPRHNGFPKVHFERLSCTVCHSGPLPGKAPVRVRTARANRLGIFGVARWATDLPAVFEPVFVRGTDGKLGPRRVTWPAFWAEVKDGAVVPMRPDEVRAAAAEILDAAGTVARVLAALYGIPDLAGIPVWVMDGRAYELNADAGLDPSPVEGGATGEGGAWAVRREGEVFPLVPALDPEAEEPDPDAEAALLEVLKALGTVPGAPGRPALAVKKALYVVTDGALEKRDAGVNAGAPKLVRLDGERTVPLVPDFALRAVRALTGTDRTLTEEQLALVLKGMGKGHAYVSGGRVFRLNAKGRLVAGEDAAAEAVTWPMAHEVRPARMSLGTNGCTDCHRANSDFLFGKARAHGPLLTDREEVRSAASFMGLDRPYQALFGLSFAVRPLFKGVLLAAASIIGGLLALAAFIALGRISGLLGKGK